MQDDPKNSLNLGLSELLGSHSEKKEPAREVKATVEESAPELAGYFALAQRAQWNEILVDVEQKLAQEIPTLELRTWWARAAFETDTVSISMLSAPLSSASFELVVNRSKLPPELVALGAETLVLVAKRLEKAGEKEDALEFLRRAVTLDPQYGNELERAATRAQDDLISKGTLSTREEEARRLKLEELAALTGKTEKHTAEVQSDGASVSAITKTTSHHELTKPVTFIATLILCGLVAIGFYTGVFSFSRTELLPALGGVVLEQKAALRTPELGSTSSPSALDGLEYDLSQPLKRPTAVAAQNPATTAQPESGDKTQGVGAPVAAQQRTTIDTSGPKEPEEVRRAVTNKPKPKEDETAQILFGSANRAPVGRPSVGTVKPRAPGSDSSEAYERFAQKRAFHVITSSSVFGEPSVKGEVLGSLKRGDRISAEGHQGPWLRIRSSSGRFGYVLEQDTEPVRDEDVD